MSPYTTLALRRGTHARLTCSTRPRRAGFEELVLKNAPRICEVPADIVRVRDGELDFYGFEDVDDARLLRLEGVEPLLLQSGGIKLDTRIKAHGEGHFGSDPCPSDIAYIGRPGVPITLGDIRQALQSIPTSNWTPGRSYGWEGISQSYGRAGLMCKIHWAS